MAEFKLSRFKYTWTGAWGTGTHYNPDDVISFGGKVYTCLVSHTANADFYADLEYYNTDVPPVLSPKWELMADGTSWLGDWAPTTYYKVGDIVRLDGVIYVCLEAHTSATPTGTPLPPATLSFEADEAKWAIQISVSAWKVDWTPATYYKINDVVRYGGRMYICNTSHTSGSDYTIGLELDENNWDLYSIADAWKGDWTISTRYKLNDVVKFGGNIYRCEVQHTSTVVTDDGLPADQGKWSLLHNGVENKGDWQPDTFYKINDLVKYGGYVYISNSYHNSSPTFDAGFYDIYCPGQQYDLIWDETVAYQIGDLVSYGGNLYAALRNQSNATPGETPLDWEVLYQGAKIRGDWNIATQYLLGDVVRRGGNIYGCILDNIGNDPDFLNDNSPTNSTYWEIIVSGMKWRGIWELGRTYTSGDTVVWISSTYICLDKHIADNGNRPDDDGLIDSTSLHGRYWAKVTEGNRINRMRNVGDIRTFGATSDGSTIGYKELAVTGQGKALMVVDGEVSWQQLQYTDNVYYVADFGVDIPTAGTSPQDPWRSIRYATEQVPAYSTIYVRTGDYEEILPIKVPAFVAIVGDEIRSVTVRPANNVFSSEYISVLLSASSRLELLLNRVVLELTVGDVIDGETDVYLYGEVPQVYTGVPTSTLESTSLRTLLQIFSDSVTTLLERAIASTDLTTNAAKLAAYDLIEANRDFIKTELTLYINDVNPTFELPEYWDHDIDRILTALSYDITHPGNYYTVQAAKYFINGSTYERNKISNMFLMRDATGLRNMTLTGLEGELGPISIYGTRRPTAGAFVSLDPGYGPLDSSVWVGTRSPYVQNVTNFGTGCIGLMIDGDIHAGGNQTIVANDFTQVLSDGIGVWANGTGRSEVISVFTYYNHIGYLATAGGKIRGANGNCSYGQFGAVSEGYNTAETPITGTINNRYYDATVYQTLIGSNNGIQKLFFSNAGEEYTNATMTISGSGYSGELEADEFRDGSVYEIRIANPGDSSAEGGSGYVFVTNSSQGGTDEYIQLAGSDENTSGIYNTMRIVLGRGTGTGQYGYIADYDDVGKYAYVAKESKPSVEVTESVSSTGFLTVASTAHLEIDDPVIFVGTKFGNIEDYTIYYVLTIESDTEITVSETQGGSAFVLADDTGSMEMHSIGWEHLVEGTAIEPLLDLTTNYYIEPRVIFSSPGFSTVGGSLPASRQWSSVAANDTVVVAVALDTNAVAYSTNDGVSWTQTTLPATALWTKVKFVGGVFMAFAADGSAAKSADGIAWEAMTMSTTAEWRDVAYGRDTWVAVATGGTISAYSTDAGDTWTNVALPEGADWNAIEYGKGLFVTTALSDSSISGAATAYSDDNGATWTVGNLTQGSYSLAYGNGRFVALSGGYTGATEVSISFNGIDWVEHTIQSQDWRAIKYAQGMFIAVATGATYVTATSRDGVTWDYQDIGTTADWCDVTYSSLTKPGKFIAISGLTSNSTAVRIISTGATTRARAFIVSGRMSQIAIWEPGSGYTTAPVMTIIDPNNSSDVYVEIRTGNGVIANPSIVNAGGGYETPSTHITVVGDGYKDEYALGSHIVVDGLTRVPGPGDNVNILGINDYTYKLLSVNIVSGTTGNYRAILEIAKDLGREESPDHGTSISIRQLYSQVRITGHDFLEIGLGNYYETNYPNTLNPIGTVVSPENQVVEENGGRVFYTSTDEEGNFRCGELFAVEQATGTVTLNAQFFQLQGLEELRLGGVTVGGSGVVIREFSTDPTFTADSNNIVPTQRAIKAYLTSRVSGGGSDATTGTLTGGVVRIGPDQIDTTTGETLNIEAQIDFRGGIDGTLLAMQYFSSWS